ncbi:MAG TPA: hypothetical protein VF017_06505 [Thermoanaerobaculia bacterium]|nr:hypothetical protein [Thermoanaerobaculia bacterium]
MSNGLPIVQVLLLMNEESAHELAPPLWAALLEVEKFYNNDQSRVAVERYFISPYTPSTSLLASALRHMGRLLLPGEQPQAALNLIRRDQFFDRRVDSSQIRGRYSGTVDQSKVVHAVSEVLGKALDGKHLLIVTDEEITPPPEWRYIVWDGSKEHTVVSTAPADPKYWRQRTPNRLSIIKHRARSACLCISGSLLGLARCDNPQCFLFRDINSVTALDFMTELGPEHESTAPDLVGRGFLPFVSNPEYVQEVVANRPSEGEF